MRTNLPQTFPIKYALVVQDAGIRKTLGQFNEVNFSIRQALRTELLKFLKTEPLLPEHLKIPCSFVACRDEWKNKIFEIPKFNPDKDWSKEAITSLKKIVPDGDFVSKEGMGFEMTMISYGGLMDTPLYFKILNPPSISNKRELDILKIISHSISSSFGHPGDEQKDKIRKKFKEITNGRFGFSESFNAINEPPVFYISAPSSKLWRALEDQKLKGVVFGDEDNLEEISKIINKTEKEGDYPPIHIAVAKSFSALITEEMIALYKESKFCQNCGEMLPFYSPEGNKYKGRYCPENENNECKRKRDTIRQKRKGLKRSQE